MLRSAYCSPCIMAANIMDLEKAVDTDPERFLQSSVVSYVLSLRISSVYLVSVINNIQNTL